MLRFVALSVLLMAASCSDETMCSAPKEWAYDCEPQASPDQACTGGPTMNGVQRDPGIYYPIGCFSGYPYCDGETVEVSRACECLANLTGTGAPGWFCGL